MPELDATDFLRGLLAALALSGPNTVTASQFAVHRAFHRVVQELQAGTTRDLNVDLIDVDYDPLYGMSSWLDRALTNAQRNMLISFPNPSYERMQIRYTATEASRILEGLGGEDKFLPLARTFLAALDAAV